MESEWEAEDLALVNLGIEVEPQARQIDLVLYTDTGRRITCALSGADVAGLLRSIERLLQTHPDLEAWTAFGPDPNN
jgi:hypothetical protein